MSCIGFFKLGFDNHNYLNTTLNFPKYIKKTGFELHFVIIYSL